MTEVIKKKFDDKNSWADSQAESHVKKFESQAFRLNYNQDSEEENVKNKDEEVIILAIFFSDICIHFS